jgi:hypothetical protein
MSLGNQRIEKDAREQEKKINNYKEKTGDIIVNQPASKYDLNILRFPDRLGNDPSLQHYVVFNINVRGKSKYNPNNRLFEITRDNQASLTSDELANVTKAGTAIAGAGLGYAAASKFVKSLPSPNTTGGQVADKGVKIVGAATGAAAGSKLGDVINSQELVRPDTSYRISDVIALHLEEKPSVKYSAEYSNKDLGTLAGILGQTAGGDITDTFKNLGEMSGEIAAAGFLLLAKLPSIFGATDIKSIVSAQSKTNLNPFREVIFEAVNFRTFSFRYRLMPRNKKESEDIFKIIKLFKFHMHPELSKDRLFFVYPAEFQITYFYRNRENKYFHKFTPSVLTDLQVDYGGEQFTSFKDGSPGEVNLQLTFRETEILTKELINEDY